MNPYQESDLEEMLNDIESDFVERKESFQGDAPKKVREAVCAFANDLPNHMKAGVVFIGARDDGSPSGCAITDELLQQLGSLTSDGNILPPPTLTVQKHLLKGKEMAVILVQPSDSPPVRYKGRVLIRVGPRKAVATTQDESVLNEKRRHKNRPFDVQPVPNAKLNDLNSSYFEDYLRVAFSPDDLAANGRTYEQQLSATKMIVSADDPIPTVLGLLTLGVCTRDFLPCAYIQFLRIDGNAYGDTVTDEQEIDGTLGDVLRRIEEKMKAHNHTAVDFTSGEIEKRVSTYPLPALQQLVRNAVLHRTYEHTNAPIHVYWFNDRIEIQSPGGPFGIVNENNFGQPGVTDYRNPNIAEALKVLGFVQGFGFGIPTVRNELKKNGNPDPEFNVNQSNILWTVRVLP